MKETKFHRFLFPFSSKFLDLNFAPYVPYIFTHVMKPVRDTNSEPGLPVLALVEKLKYIVHFRVPKTLTFKIRHNNKCTTLFCEN